MASSKMSSSSWGDLEETNKAVTNKDEESMCLFLSLKSCKSVDERREETEEEEEEREE